MSQIFNIFDLTLLHSEWPKLHGVLAVVSAIGLSIISACALEFLFFFPCFLSYAVK